MGNHPTQDELSGFVRGTLTPESNDQVAEHIEQCPPCQQTAQRLDAQIDTLMSILRQPRPKAADEDCREAIEQVAAIAAAPTAEPTSRSHAAPPWVVLGEYVIVDRLGAGGMGQVYRARHRTMNREVAIKILPKSTVDSPESVKRFQREVQAAARLLHPNIVLAYDAGQHEGTHYLVMEFVDGEDLSRRVNRSGPLPVIEAVDYVLQAARGLQFAHREGIVHRDIKPANLLVDKKGVVKILDMGLARFDGELAADGKAAEGLTQSGQVMGTVDYMAPEQALDMREADAKADIYSLGCTLYRLLMGDNVYGGETVMQRLLAHREQPIPQLSARRTDVPTALDKVFTQMMAKRPDERYQNMDEVIAALERVLNQLKAGAASPGQGDSRNNGGSQRPPVRWLVVAAGFLLFALGTLIYVYDKNGQRVATIQVPSGGSVVVIEEDRPSEPAKVKLPQPAERAEEKKTPPAPIADSRGARTLPAIPPVSKPVAKPVVPPAELPISKPVFQRAYVPTGPMALQASPLDALKRENIPRDELENAAWGDPAVAPPQLVAIVGDSRWTQWSAVTRLAYSPDGQTIATAANDDSIVLWDVASGRPRHKLQGWKGMVYRVLFSPDGKRLFAELTLENSMRVWSTETGEVLADHKQLGAPTFSGDGKYFAAYNAYRHNVSIWDAEMTKTLQTIDVNVPRFIGAIGFTPDGKTLITHGEKFQLLFWEWESGKLLAEIKNMSAGNFVGNFTFDGKKLIVNEEQLIDLGTFKPITSSLSLDHSKPLRVSPDRKLLVTMSGNDTLIVWDLLTYTKRGSFEADFSYVNGSLAFSHDSTTIAVSDSSGAVQFWNAATVTRKTEIKAPLGLVVKAELTADGSTLVAAGRDHNLRTWTLPDMKPGITLGNVAVSFSGNTPFALGPDAKTVAVLSANLNDGVRIYNLGDARQPENANVFPSARRDVLLEYLPDGKTLVVARGPQIEFWNLETGLASATFDAKKPVKCFKVSPDQRQVAIAVETSHEDGPQPIRVQIWNIAEKRQTAELSYGEARPPIVASLAFSPDSSKVVAACQSTDMKKNCLVQWDLATESVVNQFFGHADRVLCVAYSPDGKTLASTAIDGSVRLWDATNSDLLDVLQLGPSMGVVRQVSFDATGRYLVTANGNGTAYILRMAEPPAAAK